MNNAPRRSEPPGARRHRPGSSTARPCGDLEGRVSRRAQPAVQDGEGEPAISRRREEFVHDLRRPPPALFRKENAGGRADFARFATRSVGVLSSPAEPGLFVAIDLLRGRRNFRHEMSLRLRRVPQSSLKSTSDDVAPQTDIVPSGHARTSLFTPPGHLLPLRFGSPVVRRRRTSEGPY